MIDVQYDDLVALRRNSPAWRLLRAEHAPLILAFLGRIFVDDNVREISASQLAAKLDDELFALNERLGEGAFPRPARAYLDDWASIESGWLRKYYPADSDEPHFDATPAVEKAIAWVRGLQARSFVGTESRLNTVFELLRQIVYGTDASPQVRLADLQRRRAEIDAQVADVERGRIDLLDAASQRDRYQQFADTARALLADFREVEANFRTLDRQMRERIAGWDGAKGELLDDIVGNRSVIADSDQGRSFQAFYDFLLSSERQTELAELLDRVQALETIDERDPRLRHIHFDWLDAGERTQHTVRLLSDQLRRFLDDRVWLENRRVMDLLHGIETKALRLRNADPPDGIAQLDDTHPSVALPMERPLYRRPVSTPIDSENVEAAAPDGELTPLFDQVFVDRAQLTDSVRSLLGGRTQVGLAEVIDREPLRHGLAEIVGYMSLSDSSFRTVFDESASETLHWTDDDGVQRVATLPRVSFVRGAEKATG